MKLREKVIAASSLAVGSLLLFFAVSNLEFQDYTSSPLFDWKILCVAGLIAYVPGVIHIIRGELSWHDNH